ncbi:MAG: 16S rRNA (cytidine(1402)-2'-O)-methyltransferase [Pseudomonadota bacterium]
MAGPPLSPGLWLVATPIGNLGDITLRAIEVLRTADVLVCEDTRRTRRLLDLLEVPVAGRPIWSYNDHNAQARRPKIMEALAEGQSVAYASDAGTPLIADPGYRLVTEAQAQGYPVNTAPGPSAVIAALSLAGLPTDRFYFAGFLPAKSGPRRREAEGLKAIPSTLVFFESARRLAVSLSDLASILGDGREAAVVREISKVYQSVHRGRLSDLAAEFSDGAKGEIVVVIGPPEAVAATDDAWQSACEALKVALETQSVKDAVRDVAVRFDLPRRAVYTRALEITRD